MLKVSSGFALRSLKRLPRIVLIGAILLLFAASGLLLALRYWVLPDIGRYHSDITAVASQAIGQPVTIGKIEADWRGLRPRLLLTDVRVLDKQGLTALVLPRVDNVVSWVSLLVAEVRLHSMEFDQPDLLIKRDAQGMLHIAGMTQPGQAADADWLLRQPRIVVRNARITWQDDLRAAPSLELNNVNLVIENGRFIKNIWPIVDSGLHHRFALHAQPPPELSAQLDVRGEFYGKSFADLNAWSGQLYTQLDYADVAAWRAWLPLPTALMRGKGALRGWLGFERGKVSQVTVDLALAEVQTQLADDLPPLDLIALHGRAAWANVAHGFEISTQKLSLKLGSGLEIPPTDFYLRLDNTKDGQAASGEVRGNKLDLAKFVSLTDFLPLGSELKQQIAEFAPQGLLSDVQAKWQGGGDKMHYEINARFDDLSIRRVGKLPGFSGLSGYVNGSDASGSLSLNARKLTVDAPEIMPQPLAFDTLTAQVGWQMNERGLEVNFNNVYAANEDLSGNLFGSYQTVPQSPGLIDLTVHLTRAAVRHTARYIPLAALDSAAHDWLRSALLDGQADEFGLRLQGDLNDFPFDGNREGIFRIKARAQGVALEYAPEWPRIDNGEVELLIKGKRLEVNAASAMTVGGRLQKVSVVLPDILSPDLLLQVRGEAVGETAHFLDFIRHSPVRGHIDGFTDGVTVRGNGTLDLRVNIPLRGSNPLTVAGSYRFLGNDVNLGGAVPPLLKTNGKLLFTESSLRTQNVTAQILGGPATVLVQSGADGMMQAKVSGRANLDALRQTMAHPLLHYLRGSSPWQAEITVRKKQLDLLFTSDLIGLTSDLPAPFAKRADESMPLRFEKKSMSGKQDGLSIKYGDLLSAKFQRQESNGNFIIKRGLVSFGDPLARGTPTGSPPLRGDPLAAGQWPIRNGVWLTGTIPTLALEGWGALASADDDKSAPISIAGADLLIQNISGYGYTADGVGIKARERSGELVAQLAASGINGELRWQPQGNGKLTARFKNLSLEKIEEKNKEGGVAFSTPQPPLAPTPPAAAASVKFPDLDLAADSLTLGGKPLGKLEVLAQQRERDWLLERLLLTNPDGVLTADGKWRTAAGVEQTQINLKLEISNAGKILARYGYPDSVKGGSGNLQGELSWRGGPLAFSYAILDGSLKLDARKGQFLKIDPGVGKLLSILSLQALPKHLTLDFADVFSKGFAFDSITGTAQIKQGVLLTDDFMLDGSAAKATMSGQADLNHGTVNLRVRVLPTVGNTAAFLGTLAGGPVVGAGIFLFNQILRDPLGKLVSFEYNITGDWTDPNVEKVGANKPAK